MSNHHSHSGRIFWGLILIVVGGLFLLDRFGGFDFGYMISTYWPAIFIILGLSILVSSGFRRPIAGLFFILLGVFFLLDQLDILAMTSGTTSGPRPSSSSGSGSSSGRRCGTGAEKFPEIRDNDIDIVAAFSGIKRRVESQTFRGGRAAAMFGGAELDLTGATLADGKATVELTAIFGGVDIRVPKEWRVVLDAVPILGGVDDKRHAVPAAEAKATLFVKATAIFGGVTIKE